MKVEKSYDLTVDVEFDYDPEKIDPMYWVNDQGVKQHRMENIYSHVKTLDEIWNHLAWNALLNGVTDASTLDGWADLERGDLSIHVNRNSTSLGEL